VPGSEEYLIEALNWLGIMPDHPDGKIYRQSEHNDKYLTVVNALVDAGLAYHAFDTEYDLERARKNSKNFKYNAQTRTSMRNVYTIDFLELSDMASNGIPSVVRLAVPPNETITFYDEIRGEISVSTNDMDDKVLLKVDGTPTYHLASIVDDHAMEITHVIRGEEWLPSCGFHVVLYRALGWTPPKFVHLPLILGPNGKLSKRDGDKYGFPVYPLSWIDTATDEVVSGYREAGYMPEALLNIVALLGWSPGDNTEVMTLAQMVDLFDLANVNKAGAKFDPAKATWLNREHIRLSENSVLAEYLRPVIAIHTDISFTSDYIEKAVGLLKERTGFLHKLWDDGSYMFTDPSIVLFDTMDEPLKIDFITAYHEGLIILPWCSMITHDIAETIFKDAITKSGISPRSAGKVLRAALCGNAVGPSIFDIVALFGINETCRRLMLHITESTRTDREVPPAIGSALIKGEWKDVELIDESRVDALLKIRVIWRDEKNRRCTSFVHPDDVKKY